MSTLKNVWFRLLGIHQLLLLMLLLLFMPIGGNAFVVIPSAIPWNPMSISSRQLSSSCLFAATPVSDDLLSRGDARGAALRLENVAVTRGTAQILKDINFRVEPKSKWALVGTNGCGKSTLLKAIMEEIAYEGTITVGTTQQVGYLRQTAVAGSTRTILEEAASAMTDIEQARENLEIAQQQVASSVDWNPTDADLQNLDEATARFESVGGYTQEQEVSSMLKGLGFTNLTQRCDELSGGWQMRVSFARMLLSKPTLCLMDEPGNHLDRAARQWLAQYLKRYDGGAMILVTHDVELLQSMDHIAEVSAGYLQAYKSCTYQQYQAQKEERANAALIEYQRNMEKAAKLQAFVDKFGASATKASAAQSRVKQLEKMKLQGLLDAPPDTLMQERFKPTLRLPEPPKTLGETLLTLRDAQVGYTEPLVSQINLEIMRGMKLLIRGPNGAGKSTILHSLRGTLPLLAGDRMENESLRLGVFTQDLAQELDLNARAVDLVTAYAREGLDGDIFISDQDARGVMGGLGLTKDKPLRQIQALSGGEKARVALAMFALKPSNLYLLDEVSNHLDIERYVKSRKA
jgi:ATP-binding cassette subfamily F protein 3